VRLNVAVIVAVGPLAIAAARQATKTIPIVVISFDDPAPAPETNLTGITTFVPELAAQRLDLLRQVVPRLAAPRCCGAPPARARPTTCARRRPPRARAAWR